MTKYDFNTFWQDLPLNVINDFDYLFNYVLGDNYDYIVAEVNGNNHGNTFKKAYSTPENFFEIIKQKTNENINSKEDFIAFIGYLCYRMFALIMIYELYRFLDEQTNFSSCRLQYSDRTNIIYTDLEYHVSSTKDSINLDFEFEYKTFDEFKDIFKLLDYDQCYIKGDLIVSYENDWASVNSNVKQLFHENKNYRIEELKTTLMFDIVNKAKNML